MINFYAHHSAQMSLMKTCCLPLCFMQKEHLVFSSILEFTMLHYLCQDLTPTEGLLRPARSSRRARRTIGQIFFLELSISWHYIILYYYFLRELRVLRGEIALVHRLGLQQKQGQWGLLRIAQPALRNASQRHSPAPRLPRSPTLRLPISSPLPVFPRSPTLRLCVLCSLIGRKVAAGINRKCFVSDVG